MKKIASLVCILVLSFILCGCELEHKKAAERTKTADFSSVTDLSENFNNSYIFYESFAAGNDIIFYTVTGSKSSYLYAYYNNERYMLLSDSSLNDMTISNTYCMSGDSIYFDAVSNEYDNYKCYIYRYNLPEKQCSKVFAKENIENWTVVGKYIVYMTYYNEKSGFYSLYCYNTETKKEQYICNEVEAFGITNGSLRFISYNGKNYSLSEYDFEKHTSESITQFDGYSIKESVQYNFTENSIIMVPDTQNYHSEKSEYRVVDINTGKFSTYSLPYGLISFTAGKDYAYAMCQPDINAEYDLKDYGIFSDNAYDIYKVNLKNGKYELLDIASSDYTSLYVVNDEVLYILNSKEKIGGFIYEVNKYSASDNSNKKVFEYKY